MHQRGRVVSQRELVEHIYAQDFERDSNTVEVFVARLRRKLGRVVHRDRARARLPGRGGLVKSLRSRLMLGALLWTIGLVAATHFAVMALVSFCAARGCALRGAVRGRARDRAARRRA